jgi:hypothetical protein
MPDYVGSIHAELARGLPMTVAETRSFTKQAKGVLSEDEIADLKVVLAINPTAGTLIGDSGGIRKYRVRCGGKGKLGGARIIYYFHDREIPVYLLAVYAKSETVNLSDVERAAMRKFVRELIRAYRAQDAPKMIS